MTTLTPPSGVCANCYRTWRALVPRPTAVWCWHTRTLSRLTAAGWGSVHNVTDAERKAFMDALYSGTKPPEAA